MWSGEGFKHTERYDRLAEKVLAPLGPSAADLFFQLVNEKASDEEVRTDDGGFGNLQPPNGARRSALRKAALKGP